MNMSVCEHASGRHGTRCSIYKLAVEYKIYPLGKEYIEKFCDKGKNQFCSWAHAINALKSEEVLRNDK